MSAIETKMKILLGLRGFTIVKVNEKQAVWMINSNDSLNIDVSFPPELWEAKHAGKTLDWVKSPEMPANLKGMIEALVEDYTEALKAALEEVEEYQDGALQSPAGLLPEVPEAVVSPEVEDVQKAADEAEKLAKLEAIMDGDAAGTIGKTPRSRQTVTAPQKKQEWKPATKQNTKPVEEIQDAVFKEVGPVDMSVLPVPVGIGIVRPAVTAIQALAAWQEFQELKKYIIERSDIQVIQGRNHIKKSGWRKFATFYNLTDQIVEETQVDLEKGGFYWKIKVVCTAPNGRQTEGVGMCASSEKSGARMLHDTYTTAHTRAKNRAISDMIAAGEVSAEEMEA